MVESTDAKLITSHTGRRTPLNRNMRLRPIGEPRISSELCKGCGFCIEFCPKDVLEFSDKINSQGYQYPRIKPGKEEECIACGMCERICPEFAIEVYEVKKVPIEVEA